MLPKWGLVARQLARDLSGVWYHEFKYSSESDILSEK